MRAVLLLVAAILLPFPAVQASEIVRVGGYEFPPFVETNADGGHKGLTPDLIAAFNTVQDEYEFRFVPVAPRRRYTAVQDAAFDVMFFESPDWGWGEAAFPVQFSSVFLTGGEVFIARAQPERGQDYFAKLDGKRLVGILGYHYSFANFNADPDVLAKNHGMKLVSSHRSSIEMVLAGRVDIAIVTDAYLWAYLSANPTARDRLLVSEHYDQVYNHRILVRQGGPVDTGTINRLLAGMEGDGTLNRLWKKAGVAK